MTISANALAVKNENKKIENAKLEKAFAVVKKMLLRGKATIEEIAEDCDVIVDFVLDVQSQLSDK
jgi:predicted membrane chloride channel (bestrophin family)